MFNLPAFQAHLKENENLPHTSKYHFESYPEHVLSVLYKVSEQSSDPTPDYLWIAACLHDIAKPRTQGYNKIGGACFYDHEEITDEELTQFLTRDYEHYERVKALILCHMLPYHLANANDFSAALRKYCRKKLAKFCVNVEVDDTFIIDLMTLHNADDAGSVRAKEDMEEAQKNCKYAADVLLHVLQHFTSAT